MGKKLLCIVICIVMCATVFAGCSSSSGSGDYDSAVDRYINDEGFRNYVNEQ